MKSIAGQRRLVWLMVAMTGSLPVCLPQVACLSGAEQECLQATAFGTASGIAEQALADGAPRDITGNEIIDAFWNGGVDWSLSLIRQTVDSWYCCSSVQPCTPDDPFPFPVTTTPGCCN